MNLMNLPPLRSHLYVPGNKLRLLEKVHSAGADAVVLDLEDAVPQADKGRARDMVSETVRLRASRPGPATFVRINHPASGLAEDDVHAVVQPGLAGIRIPKVENPETVCQVVGWVERAEIANGLPPNSIVLICLLESAAGVFHAQEIVRADPRVIAVGYGAADFVRDVGISPGPDALETLYARSHLVLVSRVAGVRPPVDTVYRFLDDLVGLEKDARQAKALGFFGKSVIHPKQVPAVNTVFTPTEEEIAHAAKIVDLANRAEREGKGAVQDDRGEFVDVAVVRRAQGIIALAQQLTAMQGA